MVLLLGLAAAAFGSSKMPRSRSQYKLQKSVLITPNPRNGQLLWFNFFDLQAYEMNPPPNHWS
jgi:hypothetical protein